MKKIASIIGLALVAGVAHAQTNAAPSATPQIVVTTQTITVTKCAPVVISAQMMDRLIKAVRANGVGSNVEITTNNLQAVTVYRRQDGNYVANFNLK